ncbi:MULTISPECIES: hypothetical protein [unclassified Ochrobactrum]|uniref:hypothetical protein n=1 Tax=unclassified Ochrobactrum TaxID=239106 RepID=UPI0013B3BB3B|nr:MULTISPECIES: hypothetical protein [unclassified Ochrobactrum]MBQ0707307.1 hypothetical protein [Ochrobactrum sp. AP1BH01-1]
MVFQFGSIAHFTAAAPDGRGPEVSASRLPILPWAAIFDDADRTRAPLPQGQIGKLKQNCIFSGGLPPSICRSGPVSPIEVGFRPPTRLNIPRTCTEEYPREMAMSSRDIDQYFRNFSQNDMFHITKRRNAANTAPFPLSIP